LELFRSKYKFESGTGWPSFYDVIEGHVETKRDFSMILPRTEYHCGRCGGHQGHIFDVGPPPTHLRYCNNRVALKFVPEKEKSCSSAVDIGHSPAQRFFIAFAQSWCAKPRQAYAAWLQP